MNVELREGLIQIINLRSVSLCVFIVEMVVRHCDRQHNGFLILLPYLSHTIILSSTLANMFT